MTWIISCRDPVTYLSYRTKSKSKMIALDSKTFVQEYWKAISGKTKTPEMLEKYVSDPEMIAHCLSFEEAFPRFELIADDYICEEDKVVVRGHMKGKHIGDLMGMGPTGRSVDVPVSVIFKVGEEKITKCWIYLDQLEMMNQLGFDSFN